MDRMSYYRRTWSVTKDARKAETTALSAENTTNFKRIANWGENERMKGHLKKTLLKHSPGFKRRRDKRQQHAAPSEKPLPKMKADKKNGTQNEKVGKRMETALLIKPKEGKTFTEILSEDRYRIVPKDSGAEVSYIRKRKTKGGGVLIKLDPRTTGKDTFCERSKCY